MENQFLHFFLILLATHLLCDSLYKFKTWKRESNTFPNIIWLSLAIAIISYLTAGMFSLWLLPISVFITHLVVYLLWKALYRCTGVSLLLEELLHLLFTLLLAGLFSGAGNISLVYPPEAADILVRIILLLGGFAATTFLGSIVVGIWVKPFLTQLIEGRKRDKLGFGESGFPNGGQMIGILERSLIYVFIIVDQPAAIGFLIAAKSILRFGEIKDSKYRMEAEYIIIGTLMSFIFAVIVSYAVKYLLTGMT